MKKYILLGLGALVGILAVYLIARCLVYFSYDSKDLVLGGKVLEGSSPEDIDSKPVEGMFMSFDTSKYPMGYKDCIGIPNSVYNGSEVEDRKLEYLGDRYEEYSSVLSHIRDVASENLASLDYQYVSDISTEEAVRSGEYIDLSWSDIKSEDVLKFSKLLEGTNDSDLSAVDFFSNYYVVYELLLQDGPVFVVIDYSRTGFSSNDKVVDYGGILGTVIIYKENAVYEEYADVRIIYAPMWNILYYDRRGNVYTGQDIIDRAGTVIDW